MPIPQVSVLIPVCNEQSTLPRLLEYLLENDTASVDEILVCANGCTDDTPQLVRAFSRRDGRIRLLTSEKGKPRAWNLLVRSAKHDTLVFFDEDVVPRSNAISRLLSYFDSDTIIVAGLDFPQAKWCQSFTVICFCLGLINILMVDFTPRERQRS